MVYPYEGVLFIYCNKRQICMCSVGIIPRHHLLQQKKLQNSPGIKTQNPLDSFSGGSEIGLESLVSSH